MATPNNDNINDELRECARNWYFANADTQNVLLRAAEEIENLRLCIKRLENTVTALSCNDHGQGYD